MHQPLRLRCRSAALVSNFCNLRVRAGTTVGAAVKADGYGLGAAQVVRRLWDEGCRDFFVSTWWEAQQLNFLPPDSLSVLHGPGPEDECISGVRPVLNSASQIARWRDAHSGSPCDIMVDTGMNRLGIAPVHAGSASRQMSFRCSTASTSIPFTATWPAPMKIMS